MKKRHSVSHTVKQFCKMIREGQVEFNYPLQRDKNQWNLYQKSLLIYSVATDYAVPEIYSVGITERTPAGYTQTRYSVLDGKQRLTSIEEYLQNEYSLHQDTPKVRIGDYIFDIAGSYFSELDPTVQDAINDYTLTMCHFVNTTDDELAEMFFFLNNGTAMSSQQKAKARMGLQSARALNELIDHPFATDCLTMRAHQRKKAGDEQVLVQAMMIGDPEHSSVAISSKDIAAYCAELKEGKEAMFIRLEKAMDYLVEACPGSHELYKKRHAPYILALAMYAIDRDVEASQFKEWMDSFAERLEKYGDNAPEYGRYLEGINGTSAKKTKQAATSLVEDFRLNRMILMQ